ncbi:hypothetical protein N7468_004466 [Penicillium chermesinum]|uniref:Uncharacterized protein n=1 Tax=Penicillium chermesinum TaxID=63820 RepID=A0A9W9PBH6_9EURO|nr:uncharacterized protein N7468_004466 [Penicillium chermesinum]KAJ5239847.1 hypothetical protein N7468_004466 [Penicillium chermesinum]
MVSSTFNASSDFEAPQNSDLGLLPDPNLRDDSLTPEGIVPLTGKPPHYQARRVLNALLNKNIPVMEYGAQFVFRHGHTRELMAYEWTIPDAQMEKASQIVQEHGISGFGENLMETAIDGVHIHIIPLSATFLTFEDAERAPSIIDTDAMIHTPTPLKYMESLIKQLIRIPAGEICRGPFEEDLLGLIRSYVIRQHEPEICQVTRRQVIDSAYRRMESWDWSNVGNGYDDILKELVEDPGFIEELTSDDPSF